MTDIHSLPTPQKDLPFPLMKALELRRSTRKWKDEPLTDQEVSNLLWAACGITKEASKTAKSKRTAPSACNTQAIRVYVAMRNGFFLYDETNHRLVIKGEQDILEYIGTQKMMHSAPLGLIYVSDYSKMTNFLFRNDEQRCLMSAADCGFVSQNVYLYCASSGLSTVVIGLVDREKLHKVMGLHECEKVFFTQVVGKALN